MRKKSNASPSIVKSMKGKTWINESHRSKKNPLLKEKKQAVLHNMDAGDGIHVENTEAGMVVFDQGMAVLPNDGRANDIAAELKQRQRHRDQYAYVPNREGRKRDDVHAMRTTTIGLPWNEYDELGRIIRDG